MEANLAVSHDNNASKDAQYHDIHPDFDCLSDEFLSPGGRTVPVCSGFDDKAKCLQSEAHAEGKDSAGDDGGVVGHAGAW